MKRETADNAEQVASEVRPLVNFGGFMDWNLTVEGDVWDITKEPFVRISFGSHNPNPNMTFSISPEQASELCNKISFALQDLEVRSGKV